MAQPSCSASPLVTLRGECRKSGVSGAAAPPPRGSQALPGARICQPVSRVHARQGRRGRRCLALAGAAVPNGQAKAEPHVRTREGTCCGAQATAQLKSRLETELLPADPHKILPAWHHRRLCPSRTGLPGPAA